MKYAVCNELFGSMEFGRQAELAAKHGFHGVEIAPFTLCGDFSPGAVAKGVAIARKGLADAGLAFAGLHWLFVKPDGLRLTARDLALRTRSWEHLNLLLDFAGELGGGNLVFGSPKQRASNGIPHEEAMRYFLDGLDAAGPYAAGRNSCVLLESLPSADTDIMNTLQQAKAILDQLHSPGLATMFDFHNTADETEPWDALLSNFSQYIRHIHLNTMDGGWPTPAMQAEYQPAMDALRKTNFQSWISLEIFTVPEDPEQVLAETRAFLHNTIE